ncbi:MAG: NUDIX domain-containing protein [Sphingobacteriia bacterium]|nr:NUDIX domain-containing protein [Sphingobacteriia bacterium]
MQNNNKNIHVLARGVVIDQGHILLCRTLDLAINFYFLPGGHIEYNEAAQATALREFLEETGAKCQIKRFLGCLEYSFEPGHSSICHNHEYNFIFELESPDLKAFTKIIQLEQHIELVWMPFNKLNEIDFRAEPLKELLPAWLNLEQVNVFKSIMRNN